METDPDVAKLIVSELSKKPEKTIKDELKRMQKLLAKVEIVRKKTYDAAKDLLFSTSADVAKIATDETAREFNLALGAAAKAEREKRFCKTLTPAQQKAIIDGQGISGATIWDWFHRWKRSDLENISSAVQEASVEEMTVADITRKIRGTAAKGYTDGILATTQSPPRDSLELLLTGSPIIPGSKRSKKIRT